MDTKICRICGMLAQKYINIFNTDGLRSKIETCLPITVSPHCLLHDTICNKCVEDVENFHRFIKQCLENIIILEAQYNIQESCLKSKQRQDKGCLTDFIRTTCIKGVQTEDFLDVITGNHFDLHQFKNEFPLTTNFLYNEVNKTNLVEYEDTSSDECENTEKLFASVINTNQFFFDKHSDDIIKEISQRKTSKRKNETIPYFPTKICKFDSCNKRKSKPPKKLIFNNQIPLENEEFNNLLSNCLLCDKSFPNRQILTGHIFEVHGIDMTETVSSNQEKSKKRMPNLVKISDLKRAEALEENPSLDHQKEEPSTLLPTFVCPTCPDVFTHKSDLGLHIRNKHSQLAKYLCGLCSHQCNTYSNLKVHLQTCLQKFELTKKYICQICYYGEDDFKSMENHVLIHDILIEICRTQSKIFDPADYVDRNTNFDNNKNLICNICDSNDFNSFKDFSNHRRMEHSIYHCDLCNKFYGRNSHLWKHVNRLHKGHPSITCQLCYKTSASKYHLAQHFNKIHFAKRRLPYFDFKPELREENLELHEAPKEIDPTHNLYTNIITNYTPPLNEGDFKCPKCAKGFHKKVLLKKHKKNCRPKMQKDLLTRCKSCSRVFKDRQSLAKHLVNYHSEYTCEICNQKVQSKCEIVSHIRFQHPGCNLFCKICKNILRNVEDMDLHLRDHSNSYVCQFCGDSLESEIKLKMHILSLHRKILSLSCGICLKLFENQHILKDHVTLVHKEQLTPFTSCNVCGKNYGSKWKTFDHLNKSHGQIFKACKTCLEVFDSDDQLQMHCDSTGHVNKNSLISYFKTEVKEELEEDNGDTSEEIEGNSGDSSEDENEKKNKKINNGSDLVQSSNHPSKRTVYVNSNDPSCCEICYKTWPAKKHLWQHYIRCHKKVAATVCGICLKTNSSYEALQVHLKENHPTLLHGQGFGSNFICRICGRYHNASSKLRLHMVIHEDFNWDMLNSVKEEIKKEDDNINYDSLIEQVECSSQSSEKSIINNNMEIKNVDDEDDDSSTSEVSVRIKGENDSTDDSSSSSSFSSVSSANSHTLNFQNANSDSADSILFNGNIFGNKPEELDAAIKSISCEEATFNEYCNAQNENEIESAVGSIL